jgi:hypothetical protein
VLRARLKRALVIAGYYSRPSFMIFGVQKAGTTALYYYLGLHPKIRRTTPKEIHFFTQHYDRGLRWYHTCFPLPYHLQAGQMIFDVTPEYLIVPEAAARIYQYDQQIKLIAILRNPVERAYSAWNASSAEERGLFQFDDIVEQGIAQVESGAANHSATVPLKVIGRGLYCGKLQRYFELFQREQILILEYSHLRNHTAETLRQCTNFLGLPEHDWDSETFVPKNVGSYPKQMSAQTRARLEAFYRSHNEKLYQLLGVDFGWG